MKNCPEIQALMERISSMVQNQDDNSPLEVLFSHYSEFCYPEKQNDASIQLDLRNTLNSVIPEYEDQIIDLVHMICFHYERISFINGMKVGIRLASELIE